MTLQQPHCANLIEVLDPSVFVAILSGDKWEFNSQMKI
jgi:hypothetical protein